MEFEVRHSLEHLHALYDALWTERFRGAMLVAAAFALAAFAWLLLGGTVVASGVFGASLVVLGAGWLVRETMCRQVAALFAELGSQALHYRVDDAGLHETSSAADGCVRWHAFAAPRELEGFLVLPRRPTDSGAVIALPLLDLSEQARRAIEDRIGRATAMRVG